ncbi:hypothetical protein ScPMuIL_016880 [Solemya velum]
MSQRWSGRGMFKFTACGGRFYLFLFIFTLLILDVTLGRGGGRGGGGRGRGRGRGSSGSRGRTTRRFGGLTLKSAVVAGIVKRGDNSVDMDTEDDVVVCKNIYNLPEADGSRYEYFICPQGGSEGGYDSCCGIKEKQYCCPWIKTWRFYLTIAAAVLLVFCMCGLLVYICNKKLPKGGRRSHITSRESGKLLGDSKATNSSPAPPDRAPLTITVPLDGHEQLSLSYVRTIVTNSSNNNRPLAYDHSNAVVRNNRLVVADRRENVIQLFDLLTGKLLDQLQIQISGEYYSLPCRIVFIANQEVIVVHDRSAHFISVSCSLKLLKTVELKDCICDICYLRPGSLAALSNSCVYFMDMNMDITKTITGDEKKGSTFQRARLITAISENTMVVFDAGNNTLFCLTEKGHTIWRFVSDRIPEAVCNFGKFVIMGMYVPRLVVLNTVDGEKVGNIKLNADFRIYDLSTFDDYIVIARRDVGACSDMLVYKCVVESKLIDHQVC